MPGFPLTALRLAVRSLARRPALVITAVVTLALGIGANTAVFTVVRSLLVRPLPFADADRLVAVWPGKFVANREIDALRTRTRTLEQVAGFSPGWLMALTGVANPVQLNAARVSGNMFEMLGVRPAVGRLFGAEAETPGQDQVAVLSDALWRDQFGADARVVGRSIILDGTSYQVIAVMPPGFRMFDVETDLWTPLPMDHAAMTWAGPSSVAYGKLARGTTVARASAELGTLAANLRDDFKLASDWAVGSRVVGLQESMVAGIRTMLLVLSGAVGFLLLIALANVAGLMTLRTVERAPELAVRMSLGASRRQLMALLLTEGAVIAGAGGLLGAGLGVVGVAALRRILPRDVPRLAEISIDGTVLMLTLGLLVLATIVIGLAPAAGRRVEEPSARLRDGRTVVGGHRTRGVLVAAEVALTVVLLVGTGLMARSLLALTRVDPGLRADRLLTMRLQPTGFASPEALKAYWRDVLGRLRETPGVEAAATVLHLPTSGRSWHSDVEIDGRPLDPGAPAPRTAWQSVSTGYFAAAGVPLVGGRDFTPDDREGSLPVIVVNRSFVERIFPGENPLGRRIKAGNATRGAWATIVGVVGGVRHDSLSAAPEPEVYRPFEQLTVGSTSLVIRTRTEPEAMAGGLRRVIWSVDRNVPISQVRSMAAMFRNSLVRPRVVAELLAAFAAIGLILGLVGVFGIAVSWARQRKREIAVRMALGAAASMVIRLVVGQAVGYAAAGLAAGTLAAVGLTGAMRGLLYGVGPADPPTFAVVVITIGALAALAAWLPARQAAGADPTVVLRDD